MKSVRPILTAALPGLAMAVLILDAKTALEGAQNGLELCLRAVVPSLFPFLFLSVMVTGSLLGRKIPILRPLGRLCRVPEGAESLLAVGLIGGYPVGAQAVTQAYREGRLSKAAARRMLGFCSNAGPSFIFGMLSGVFEPGALWALWSIHILSALLTGALLPGGSGQTVKMLSKPAPSPALALERSIKVMSIICGWVIVFRVLLAFLQRWFLWMLPPEAAIAITGLLELTNGCCILQLAGSGGMRFILATVLLGFGGGCVGLQTVSVTGDLGTGLYFPGKLIQGAISLLMAWAVHHLLFPAEARTSGVPFILSICAAYVVVLIILKLAKKHSSNLARQGV